MTNGTTSITQKVIQNIIDNNIQFFEVKSLGIRNNRLEQYSIFWS